jgi:hypothetical protein
MVRASIPIHSNESDQPLVDGGDQRAEIGSDQAPPGASTSAVFLESSEALAGTSPAKGKSESEHCCGFPGIP